MMPKKILVAVLALSACSCFDWTNSQTGPTTTEKAPTPSPAPTATPVAGATPAACPAVSRIAVSVPLTLGRGQSTGIDATPKDAQGVKRPEGCDIASGIVWIQSGPCSLDKPNAFNPTLTGGPGTGDCRLQAIVDEVRSDVMTVAIS